MAYDLSSRATRDPLIATTVIAVFAVLTTAIRLKARRMRKMRFTLDDYLMFATLVRLPMPLIINFFIDVIQLLEIASIGLLYSGNTPSFDESPMLTPIAVINGGDGRPIDEVNPADIPKLFKVRECSLGYPKLADVCRDYSCFPSLVRICTLFLENIDHLFLSPYLRWFTDFSKLRLQYHRNCYRCT